MQSAPCVDVTGARTCLVAPLPSSSELQAAPGSRLLLPSLSAHTLLTCGGDPGRSRTAGTNGLSVISED